MQLRIRERCYISNRAVNKDSKIFSLSRAQFLLDYTKLLYLYLSKIQIKFYLTVLFYIVFRISIYILLLIFLYRKSSKLKAIIIVIITLKHCIETKLTSDTIANITHMANVLLNSRNSRIRPECPSCCYRKIYR